MLISGPGAVFKAQQSRQMLSTRVGNLQKAPSCCHANFSGIVVTALESVCENRRKREKPRTYDERIAMRATRTMRKTNLVLTGKTFSFHAEHNRLWTEAGPYTHRSRHNALQVHQILFFVTQIYGNRQSLRNHAVVVVGTVPNY